MNYNRELLCKDCRHSYRPWINKILLLNIYQCRLPGNKHPDEYDPVTGKTTPGDYNSCGVSRLSTSICGPQAMHWVPRDSRQHLFTVLKQNYERKL